MLTNQAGSVRYALSSSCFLRWRSTIPTRRSRSFKEDLYACSRFPRWIYALQRRTSAVYFSVDLTGEVHFLHFHKNVITKDAGCTAVGQPDPDPSAILDSLSGSAMPGKQIPSIYRFPCGIDTVRSKIRGCLSQLEKKGNAGVFTSYNQVLTVKKEPCAQTNDDIILSCSTRCLLWICTL